MIKIPRLDESDLKSFIGKEVVIYGAMLPDVIQLYSIFKHYKIKVIGYHTNGESVPFVAVLTRLIGLKQIRLAQLKKIVKKDDEIVLQTIREFDSVVTLSKQLGVERSTIGGGWISFSFADLTVFKLLKSPITYFICNAFWKIKIKTRNLSPEKFLNDNVSKKAIIVCSPPKTADCTLRETMRNNEDFLSGKIKFINLGHRPQRIKIRSYQKKLKANCMIIGIREPISQNLSLLYENIATGNMYFDWLLGVLEHKSFAKRVEIINDYERFYLEHGNDAQRLFEKFIERYVYPNEKMTMEYPRAIQDFIPAFSKYAIDITAYPFDKEKGYTVIKNENTEIFVYQLEKLNELVPELAAFIGVDFDRLENDNQASGKWIAESYKQAKKEIEITQEYFDKCFDEPYVKHCYSEADIEKFKARWRPHVKKGRSS